MEYLLFRDFLTTEMYQGKAVGLKLDFRQTLEWSQLLTGLLLKVQPSTTDSL